MPTLLVCHILPLSWTKEISLYLLTEFSSPLDSSHWTFWKLHKRALLSWVFRNLIKPWENPHVIVSASKAIWEQGLLTQFSPGLEAWCVNKKIMMCHLWHACHRFALSVLRVTLQLTSFSENCKSAQADNFLYFLILVFYEEKLQCSDAVCLLLFIYFI